MTGATQQKPVCVGIIMDGNRRWARERGSSTLDGHRAGYEKLKEVTGWARERGIANLIVYAFSSENWRRSDEEVSYLLTLLRTMLGEGVKEMQQRKTKLRFVGDISRFPEDIEERIKEAQEATSGFDEQCLAIALSYGGRDEILQAVKQAREAKDMPDEKVFSSYLWTSGIPDPDIIIRTGGEKRLSGFLPWQSVYSELFFIDTYWPDFSLAEFDSILEAYVARERRFGR